MPDLFSPDRCYRPYEVARTLNISKKTVYRMIADVKDPLPAFRPDGKQLRISGKVLNSYVESHRVVPENE